MPGQHRRARHATHHPDRLFRPARSRRPPPWQLPLGLAGALFVTVSYVNAHPTRPSVVATGPLRSGEVAGWDGSTRPGDPAQNNPAPLVELGTRLSASTPGTITASLFYKHPENTGTHTGTPSTGVGTVPKPILPAPTATSPEPTPTTTARPTVPPTATGAPAPTGCRPDDADTGWQHTGATSNPQPCDDGGILQILTPGTPIDGGDGRCGVNIVIPLPGHHRCSAGGR